MATSSPSLTLSADQSEVKAGGTILLTAVLTHGGTEPGEYALSLRGVDAAWATFYPPTLSVVAGGQATATILIAPPVNAAAADLTLTVRAVSTAANGEAEATFSVRLTSTTGAATGKSRQKGHLTWPRLLMISAGVIVVVAAVGIFFVLHRHSPPPAQHSTDCASQPTQLVDLYSDDTTTAIRISDPDLADVRILRTEPSDTLSPLFSSLLSLSPDGSHLAYITAGNEALDDAHLWSIDVANPAQRQELATIPHGLWQVRPAWSSDNHQVAFLRLNEQQAAASQTQLELWVAEIGGQPHKVASPPELRPDGFYGSTTQPLCWAQDNQSVIFSSVTRDASPTDQGARATGSSAPADNLNPGAPQQIAVNVQTGATEQLATPVAAADAATIPAGPAGGAGCGLPVFSQNDPAWRNVIMQSSGDTIGKFGCAVTATAMLLNYYGSTMTPTQLNTCLGENADLIQWSSVVPCANGAITASNAFDFAWPSLDQVLASGNPAIVGMIRGQTGLHFVVVTAGGGGEATDYAVIDPWDGTTTKTLQNFLDAGYNLRWIRTYTGTEKACPRLVAPQTPAADPSGIAPVPDGPLLVPSQLLPSFAKIADQTGVPRELLLAIARIESGFTPRSVGPLIERFNGTEDAHALGMMQFLPSTYRSYSAQVDAARAKSSGTAGTFHALSLQADNAAVAPLGDAGIWDPEASAWAAAFFLQQHGVATDPRGAIFAYNNSNSYVDLVLKTAQQYKAGTIPDPNQFDPNGTSKPGTLAAPNPVNPPPLSAADAAAAVPPSVKQANAAALAKGGGLGASSGSGVSGGGTSGSASGGTDGSSGGTQSGSGGTAPGASGSIVPIRWSVPEGSISRTAVLLNFNTSDNIGQIVKLSLLTLTVPGSTASPINESTPSRPLTSGMTITDDGVYEAVAVTRQNGETRTSRRKFTIDRTAPVLDLSVVSAGTGAATPAAGASPSVTAADALHPVGDGAIRLKIGYADTLSGVASIEYRIDGGDWQLYFNAVAFKGDALIDIPGDYTVTVRATDVAGNVSQERSLDFTVKADPNKPFVANGPPSLKPVSAIANSFATTIVAVVPSPTAATTAGVTVTTTAAATGAITPTAQATATGTPAGTPQAGTAIIQTPTITPTIRSAPAVLAPALTNVTPAATAGVTATVTTTTPTVAATPAITPTVSPTATAVTATPKISPTPSAQTTTPTTTVTTTVTVTTTPSPAVKLTAPTCADAAVRSISSCTAVTITNSGTTDLRINNINTTGEFLIGDAGSSCTTALAPTASCNIPILFIPTTIGKRSGSLTITDSSPDSPHTIALTGNGVGAPAVAFAPPLFTCPETELSRTSQCSVTLTNTGSAPLTIASGIVVTGDFSPDPKGTDCGLTLGVSAHCTLSVIFAPTVHGIRTGVMTVTDSAPGSPHPLSITGKGLAPGITLTAGFVVAPASVNCPNTVVGTVSTCIGSLDQPQPLTLTNTGDGELDVSSIIPHDDFIKISDFGSTGQLTTCTVLQPNQNCTLSIIFAPKERGTHVSGLTFTDNVLGSPQTVQITGQAIAPVVSLSTQPVTCLSNSTNPNFQGVVVGTSSPCGTSFTLTDPPITTPLILTNTGDSTLTIRSIVPNDPFLTVSALQTTVPPCPTTQITPTCQLPITITFKPTERGIHTSGLTITDDANGGSQSVPITVQGLAPAVLLSAAAVTCPDTVVGLSTTQCSPNTLTLKNNGDSLLHISGITPSSDFSVGVAPSGTNCGPILAVNGVCTLQVTFAPTVRGVHEGGLTIADDAADSPQSVQLTGTGIAPLMSLSTRSVTCPNTPLGLTGTCTLTFTNTGTTAMTIKSIVLNGDFTAASSCTSPIQPQSASPVPAPCMVTLTFAPIAAGNRVGSLTITDDAPDSPQTIALAGFGQAPLLTPSPSSITCPDTAVGAPPGTCQSLTLTNGGDADLKISSIVASDDFKITAGQCLTTLPATSGANTCPLSVTFAPTSAGNHVGGLTITDNASDSPQSVQLTATGLAPAASLSPSPLLCGGTPVGTPLICPLVTLVNSGNATLSISSIVMDGNYAVTAPATGGCQATLAANATHNSSCTMQVTFAPTVAGSRVGSLTIADNAPGSPHAIALNGTGQAPVLSLNPSSVACPSVGTAVGTSVTCGTLTLTNSGDMALAISSITATDDFKVSVPTSGGCGTTLAASSNCTLTVTFMPTTSGSHTGSVTIVDSAAGSPHSVQVTGTGLAPLVSFDVSSVACPDTEIGKSNPCPVVTLTNTGNAPLHLTSSTANNPFSKASDTCGTADLGPGANCKLTVAFAPGTGGIFTGFLTVADNAVGSPHTVPLSGNGVGVPAATVTAAGTCPDTTVGATANCTTLVTVANASSATGNLVMSLISISSEFGINSSGSTCGTILTPGNNCVLAITFTPAADGQRNGAVTITDNAPGSPQSVNLTGKGLGTVAITVTPTSLTCPDTLVGTTGSCQTPVTITNSGTAQLTLSGIAITGDYALNALTTSTCGTSVAPGASCTLAMSFTPTAAGARPGSVAITDNAPASPQTVTLTGNGTQPGLTVSPTSITCGATTINTPTVCSTTITNPGTAALTLNPSITPGSDFHLHTGGTNACTTLLAANNATCTLFVDFTPTATGARTGTLSLGDNAPGGPHTVGLSGTGTQPTVTLSTNSITCSDTVTAATGTCQEVVITNGGPGILTFSSTTTASPFGVNTTVSTCSATLAANTSCSVAVYFTPTATGPATGTLTITDNASGSPQLVGLTGNGVATASPLNISPVSATCGSIAKGSSSACSTVTLTNTSTTTAITFTSKTAAPATEFAISGTTCGSSLAVNNATCTLAVSFTPAEADARDGTVTIVYDPGTGSRTAVIPYSGTGT